MVDPLPPGADCFARARKPPPPPTSQDPWKLPLSSWSAVAWTSWGLQQRDQGPVVVVADGPRSLEALYQDLHAIGQERSETHLFHYPGWAALPENKRSWNQDLAGDRLHTLKQLVADPDAPIVIATDVQALLQRTCPPDTLKAVSRPLAVGETVDPDALSIELESLGYRFEHEVNQKGEAVRRGGLIDLWPPDQPHPLRVEFFDDEIDSIRAFEPGSQRSFERLDRLLLAPAFDPSDASPETLDSVLQDYLPESACWIAVDPPNLQAHATMYEQTLDESDSGALIIPWELGGHAVRRAAVLFTDTPATPFDLALCPALPGIETANASHPEALEEARKDLLHEVAQRIDEGWQVELYFNTEGAQSRFAESVLKGHALDGKIPLHLRPLTEGFISHALRTWVLGEADLYGTRKAVRGKYDVHSKTRKGPAEGQRFADWTDIQPGELVVHVDHGIGKYLGMYGIDVIGRRQEVLSVEYADGGKLHIPVGQAHLLSRYVGVGNSNPELHQLGGKRWSKDKQAAEEAVQDFAAQMLETQAQRAALPGHAFPADTPWQHAFESTFPWQETADQEGAIRDVKADLESTRPMDRLICGDVGYGKTEVAMRAAFKAVMDGKQVAVLVPTTILAQQHYDSFRERMASFPVRIEMLSRFRTKAQQRDIVEQTKQGQIDILIGTHRLVQSDVGFADLGLVVIDEEQRFGVRHKERLKEMKTLVDVLTLSATPIPRTLYLSLTGARDMSTISTPPQERLPIETMVSPWDVSIIRKAVLRELNREGQVFFLHNRVATIAQMHETLKKIVPEARIQYAHGQMGEKRLEDLIHRFIDGQFDVLLCTTIIESGVDIPNVNTIFIDRADRFGLSELYQLRGRVGRYKHQAYCYLLLPESGLIAGDARRRIRALQRYSSLGAGFKLAMRDLEIRGAGNLLGSSQSGHITAVGFELYCQLLERTVKFMNGEVPAPVMEVTVRLDFIDLAPERADHPRAAVLPATYIEEESQRLEAYRKLAALADAGSLDALRDEMTDRFGRFPKAVQRLFAIAEARIHTAALRAIELEVRDRKVMLRRRDGSFLQPDGRFPRLKATAPDAALRELNRLLRNWPAP